MNREKLEQKNLKPICTHPKEARGIYCEVNRDRHITGHICTTCGKILDLTCRKRETPLPKIARALFDQL